MHALRLLAVLAHPDDESLGCGGVLAAYAAPGVETSLVTATRGQRGRFHGHATTDRDHHPGPDALGAIREAELRAAAAVLGVRDVTVLDYCDQELDRAVPGEIIGHIVAAVRRVRPQVVLTFGPDGVYGHPDHIAISQFTTAALVAAAEPTATSIGGSDALPPHSLSKLYYMILAEPTFSAYQHAFRVLSSTVDGSVRQAVPFPEWAVTTVVDTRAVWATVARAVMCHASQVSTYGRLADLGPEDHQVLWGHQAFYRAFSRVNGGRARETDLFEGLRQ
jgi:LmbE family N-acetylglucosaminyl deacetylase